MGEETETASTTGDAHGGKERGMSEASQSFPAGRPLFIGSLPFHDHDLALGEVLRRTPETPHWVQLPSHPREDFLVQFCEGLPGLRVEPAMRIDNRSADFEAELLAFYEDFLEVTEGGRPLEATRFEVSREAAPGIRLLREALEGRAPLVVKGQVSGPLTVLTGIQDADGRWAYYDERIRDATVKLLCLKARWQAEFLRQCGHPVMVFVDEPALGHLGSSAYIGISPLDAQSHLREVVQAIDAAGAWPGLHVCANADWGTLLVDGLRVLSFDAFSYFDRVVLFRQEILRFLDRGGMLAWGIVPTSPEALRDAQARAIVRVLMGQAQELAGAGRSADEILTRSFITPSCGLGSLPAELASRAMDLTAEVSTALRGNYIT
jgi:hypothetical protein